MTKKVPPYLRHKKPPYTIHAYSAVLAARSDMVPWYTPPEVKRVEPIMSAPAEIELDAPQGAMSDEDFKAAIAEERRVEALRKEIEGNGTLEAAKGGKVQAVSYDMQEPFVLDVDESKQMSEADFALIAEPEADHGPQSPMPHADDEPGLPLDAPVEGTPAGNAAKRHGKQTRPKAAVDEFRNVSPPGGKQPSPFGGKAPANPFAAARR